MGKLFGINFALDPLLIYGFGVIPGFGVSGGHALGAAGAIFRYLRENHRDRLTHINRLTSFDSGEYMHLDYSSVRNLELTQCIASGAADLSLFAVIDHTQTPPGAPYS